jgi:hypothetical protein
LLVARLKVAEAHRRACEDLAFLNRFEESRANVDATLAEYQALSATTRQISDAYTALDEMRADTAHLIAWRCRRQQIAGNTDWNAAQTQSLLKAIDQLELALQNLPATLASEEGLTAAAESLTAAMKETQSRYQPLENAYRDEVDLVVAAAKDNPIPEHYRRLAALLSVAPLGGGSRAALLERRDELAAKLYSERGQGPAGNIAASQPATESNAGLESLTAFSAWTVGGGSDSASAKELRTRLAALQAAQQQSLLTAWKEAAPNKRAAALPDIDERSRRAAAFAPAVFDAAAPEPAEHRYWIDLLSFARWQERRVLDDFWGNAAQEFAESTNSTDSRSATSHFFDVAASRLGSAELSFANARAEKGNAISAEVVKALQTEVTAADAELQASRAAAKAGLAPQDGRLPARLFGIINAKVDFVADAALPAGLAAAWVPSADGLVIASE